MRTTSFFPSAVYKFTLNQILSTDYDKCNIKCTTEIIITDTVKICTECVYYYKIADTINSIPLDIYIDKVLLSANE